MWSRKEGCLVVSALLATLVGWGCDSGVRGIVVSPPIYTLPDLPRTENLRFHLVIFDTFAEPRPVFEAVYELSDSIRESRVQELPFTGVPFGEDLDFKVTLVPSTGVLPRFEAVRRARLRDGENRVELTRDNVLEDKILAYLWGTETTDRGCHEDCASCTAIGSCDRGCSATDHGAIEDFEECNPTSPLRKLHSCEGFGFSGGGLVCRDDCTVDTQYCGTDCVGQGQGCISSADCCGELHCDIVCAREVEPWALHRAQLPPTDVPWTNAEVKLFPDIGNAYRWAFGAVSTTGWTRLVQSSESESKPYGLADGVWAIDIKPFSESSDLLLNDNRIVSTFVPELPEDGRQPWEAQVPTHGRATAMWSRELGARATIVDDQGWLFRFSYSGQWTNVPVRPGVALTDIARLQDYGEEGEEYWVVGESGTVAYVNLDDVDNPTVMLLSEDGPDWTAVAAAEDRAWAVEPGGNLMACDLSAVCEDYAARFNVPTGLTVAKSPQEPYEGLFSRWTVGFAGADGAVAIYSIKHDVLVDRSDPSLGTILALGWLEYDDMVNPHLENRMTVVALNSAGEIYEAKLPTF